ncbi:hypothetical protein B0A49_07307 [Cryomyces minteri]|uniref:C2H2-type domain-containing protein n=1 Tax=Cryomyces minteri TaxID=331657 RepID=A0A4V5NFN3_9PEZI|nr:hypothetical protein B0A49_07307 [Cryomyces minteri]
MSLDQTIAFTPRPDAKQDGSTVSITNTGLRPTTPQHYLQETQQQCLAQPGYQQQQNQQLPQDPRQEIAPPEQAIQHLNEHIKSFYETYGHYVSVNVPPMPAAGLPRPSTPPNRFPSPSDAVRMPMKREQLDIAPMPASSGDFGEIPLVFLERAANDNGCSFSINRVGSDMGYESSYQSSIMDPQSPSRSSVNQHTPNLMPTLFEEVQAYSAPNLQFSDSLVLRPSSHTSQDLGIYFDSDPRLPSSPPCNSLDFDATIEDTGISPEEVAAFISEQSPHDQKWTCLFTDCGKRFGRKENIRSHVQTHLGDRQFKCIHCLKCFVRQHDLKRHAKIHTGDKPHKCQCGNGFARQDALTRHRQRGVCIGALPGYVRREVKRGRPRKHRPELEARSEKASRARKVDARHAAEESYGSSSSGASERSYPVTPPHTSDGYNAASFGDFSAVDSGYASVSSKPYQDTPPSSPIVLSSPAKTDNHSFDCTSTFDFATGTINPQAGGFPAVFSAHASPSTHGRESPVHRDERDNTPSPINNDFEQIIASNTATFDFGNVNNLAKDHPFSPSHSDNTGHQDFDFDITTAQDGPYSPNGTSSDESQIGDFDRDFDAAINQLKSSNATAGAEEYGSVDFTPEMYGSTDALFDASMEAWMST